MTLTHSEPNALGAAARRAALLLAAAALPAVLALPAPVAAAPVTKTFTAGANQKFTVPAGVTRLTVTATGESGQSAIEGGAGGTGATVTGTLTVVPGATYYVNVDTGGGAVTGQRPGGTGGGASDIRTCSSARASCALTGVPGTDPRLIVAAGGGGGGGGSTFTGYPVREATGGDAGDTGKPGGERPESGGGGGGGTQTLGGKAGAACPEGFSAGTNGTPGTGGTGGGGFGGGGGGGGWHGGGGGGGCFLIYANGTAGPGGGGGGSNLVPAGGTSGPATGSARVSITYSS